MLEAGRTEATGAARPSDAAGGTRLRGWKEIGRYFGVDERTVKRWENQRGLPVHRLPGEARAPVFAFAGELDAWLARHREAPAADPEPARALPEPARPKRPWPLVAMLLLAAGAALWFGVRAVEGERVATVRTGELAALAAAQVAALNDQLDAPQGTLAVRAELAGKAVAVLAQVATLPRADTALKREAAEAWRRLAVLQNAVDRPSLRDRAAARRSLAQALSILEADESPEAAAVRARVQLEAARQAAGAGALAQSRALLEAARAVALADPSGQLAQDWWLARAEVAGWSSDHEAALAAARRANVGDAATPLAMLRRLKARDLEAEALYYLGDMEGARIAYGQALAEAGAGVERWPTDSRLRWNRLRQRWNLGSTLVAAGDARAAVPELAAALAGWRALATADPSDEALAAWVLATRLSYGQALVAAGRASEAIPVLSDAVAERRRWLEARPEDADRRRTLVKALASLGDALAGMGREPEACTLYAEAGSLLQRMAAEGQETGHDRTETLRLIEGAQQRHCRNPG